LDSADGFNKPNFFRYRKKISTLPSINLPANERAPGILNFPHNHHNYLASAFAQKEPFNLTSFGET